MDEAVDRFNVISDIVFWGPIAESEPPPGIVADVIQAIREVTPPTDLKWALSAFVDPQKLAWYGADSGKIIDTIIEVSRSLDFSTLQDDPIVYLTHAVPGLEERLIPEIASIAVSSKMFRRGLLTAALEGLADDETVDPAYFAPALEDIVLLLNDEHPTTRMLAAGVLEKLGPHAADILIDVELAFLAESRSDQRTLLARAIVAIRGESPDDE